MSLGSQMVQSLQLDKGLIQSYLLLSSAFCLLHLIPDVQIRSPVEFPTVKSSKLENKLFYI